MHTIWVEQYEFKVRSVVGNFSPEQEPILFCLIFICRGNKNKKDWSLLFFSQTNPLMGLRTKSTQIALLLYLISSSTIGGHRKPALWMMKYSSPLYVYSRDSFVFIVVFATTLTKTNFKRKRTRLLAAYIGLWVAQLPCNMNFNMALF